MQIKNNVIIAAFACFMPTVIALAQASIPVQVQPLSAVLVDMERSAPADVRSLNAATISAEVTAVVKKVLADIGQNVKKGDLLVELDATDYRLTLQKTEAILASALARKLQADQLLTHARELGANQYLSADDLLARETDVMVIAAQIQEEEASVAIALRNLEKCQISAPFDGVVNQRFAQLGAYVTPGSPLLGLTQTNRFELDAEIPDELAASLKQANSITFKSRNETWQVEVLRLSNVVDAERRSRRARFGFIGDAPAVGRSGEVIWRVAQGLMPVHLLVRRNGVLGVFLHKSDKALFTPLPGAQEGRPVVVDLPQDAEIIVRGRDRLQDGDSVVPSR